jgi:hypothetical protein
MPSYRAAVQQAKTAKRAAQRPEENIARDAGLHKDPVRSVRDALH